MASRPHLELSLFKGFIWMDESLQNRLKAEGYPALGRSQSMILLAVENGTTRPSHLAGVLGISRQAVQQQLNDLINLGLLQMVPDPDDGRAKIVQFTHSVNTLGARARQILREIEAELESRIGQQAFAQLQAALNMSWGAPVVSDES